MMERDVSTLSGGELQRVAIALCLGRDADIYLLDEPSAYLDSNQRMEAARTIRRVMEREARTGLIVDHDVYFLDMVSDSLMVFSGDPGRRGVGEGPFPMREGMNRFLKMVGITFRRDAENFRGSRCHRRDDPTEVEVSGPGATHQEGKGRGDAGSTGGRFVESGLFFLERVRRVVARDGVDPAVAERVPQRFAVYGRSKRRIHFSLRPESLRSVEEEVQR